MKSTSLLWNIGSPGTDLSGFSALPGGYRNKDGIFRDIMDVGYFWSTTENNSTPSRAWHRLLVSSSSNVERTTSSGNDKRSGASVRCLKDWLFSGRGSQAGRWFCDNLIFIVKEKKSQEKLNFNSIWRRLKNKLNITISQWPIDKL